MDPNPLLFLEKPPSLINMDTNLINYYGTLSIPPSDMMTNVISQKWTIMNFVLELLIVISVPPIFTVVGVKLL